MARSAQQQNVIDAAFAKYHTQMQPPTYIRTANEELMRHVHPSPAATFGRSVAPSLASEDPAPRMQAHAVAAAATSAKRSNFALDISAPSVRRKFFSKAPFSPPAPSQQASGGLGASRRGSGRAACFYEHV
ncbi:unnamed protein product [Prorocentrum cordatum]|uniref:Uncharacterized protein n=1 Tax=Prorocentrum cordatum TaxID=2364126 RepID=A0ABN9R390_9DINO|nr:unnamed protein product [Polarella glacialis]